MTINDALKGRDNNFNLVRFLAAFAVLFDHISLASLGPGVHKPVFEQMFGMSLSIELILRPIVGGLGTLCIPLVVHLITLPTEFDASFRRAMPLLVEGEYIPPEDIPAARRILWACSLTYVAGALVGLLNIWRWIRVLRR